VNWPVYLACAWGIGALCAHSHLARPAREALVSLLERVEYRLWPGPAWLSRGPSCPACVAFWSGLGLAFGGYGPPATLPLTAALVAYGVAYVLAVSVERLSRGLGDG
jgi:hypothetical protein